MKPERANPRHPDVFVHRAQHLSSPSTPMSPLSNISALSPLRSLFAVSLNAAHTDGGGGYGGRRGGGGGNKGGDGGVGGKDGSGDDGGKDGGNGGEIHLYTADFGLFLFARSCHVPITPLSSSHTCTVNTLSKSSPFLLISLGCPLAQFVKFDTVPSSQCTPVL